MNNLSYRIDGDVSGAVRGLDQFSERMRRTEAAGQSFGRSVDRTQKQLAKLPNTSNQATQSLINLSRVAQDAPYGFIGIANNLNPLLESFQRLKASSGSTGVALQSLKGALLGPAGIGLALGVVSSLLVSFGDKLFSAKSSLSDFAKVMSETKDQFATAYINVNALRNEINLAKDGFISKDGVVKHYNETIGKTTGFVKNLNEAEQALNKNAEAYIQYTLKKAIANVALQKAAEAAFKIEENRLRQLEGVRPDERFTLQSSAFDAANRKIDRQNQKLGNQEDLYKKIANQANAAAANISKAFGFNFFDDNKGGTGVAKKIEDALKGLKIERKVVIPVDATLEFKRLQFVLQGKDLDSALKELPEVKRLSRIVLEPQINLNPKVQLTRDKQEELKRFSDEISKVINDGLQNAFEDSIGGFAEGIGKALTGGGIKDAFQAFAGAIGGALQAIGKQLIGIGIAALAAKKALVSLFTNPALAIAAGAGLVAVGAALNNALSNFGGFRAKGGPVSSGKDYIVGENGPEIFSPNVSGRIIPNGGAGAVSLGGRNSFVSRNRTVIRGNYIYLANQRTGVINNRLGG